MAPNNNFPRNHSIVGPNDLEEDSIIFEVIDSFSIFQIDLVGNRISEEDMFNLTDPNCTLAVVDAFFDMEMNTKYIGCINCRMPIAYMNDIIQTIYARQHNYVAVAHAVLLSEDSLMIQNTFLGPFSRNIWETSVQCGNCGIYLSIPALTVYNNTIENYSFDLWCVILDAASIGFFIKLFD